MNYRKALKTVSFLGMLCLIVSSPVWAGGAAEEPPTNGTIQGPEVWATVVVDCVNDSVYIRAKRIVECVVEKQAMALTPAALSTFCPSDMDEGSPLYEKYGVSGSLFGIMGAPIITKVKNFQHDTDGVFDLYSFDAQIKFFIETTVATPPDS